jgi:hypothetical protein
LYAFQRVFRSHGISIEMDSNSQQVYGSRDGYIQNWLVSFGPGLAL